MPADNLPLLLLAKSKTEVRSSLPNTPIFVGYPSKKRQKARLDSKFLDLERSFHQSLSSLRRELNGTEPEHIVVLETVGTVDDFYRAVKDIAGLEWLYEFEGEEIEPDEDFHYIKDEETDLSKTLNSRLYFVSTSDAGIKQLLSLWRTYKKNDGVFPRGLGRWKILFSQLRDVRTWELADRLQMTGVDRDIGERLEQGSQFTFTEIELWFREDATKRRQLRELIYTEVSAAGGEPLKEVIIPEIRHHSVLCRLPVPVLQQILAKNPAVRVGALDAVMFFRPTGQAIFEVSPADGTEQPESSTATPNTDTLRNPVTAVFDGVPVANHPLLSNRIVLDDPDNLQSACPVQDRHHGTAMCSLVIHGDLGAQEIPLKHSVHVRPIFRIFPNGSGVPSEGISESESPVDVIHRAVVRLLRPDTGTAPTVKVINLSFGEKYRPFYNHMSPLSRLLDWLSYEFNVLFVVSAGNFHEPYNAGTGSADFEAMSWEARQSGYLKTCLSHFIQRKILSPAESINALTVGACNSDAHAYTQDTATSLTLTSDHGIVAPYSSFGLGYRNAIKPDVLAPGGRVLHRFHSSNAGQAHYVYAQTRRRIGPGTKSACPPTSPGSMSETNYTCGTSNSAALVTRLASKIVERIEEISESQAEVSPIYYPVIVKALIVHGALWGNVKTWVRSAVGQVIHPKRLKNTASRMFGYGAVAEDRSLFAEPHRATTISFGEIKVDQSILYELPLPRGLSGSQTVKRVVVTLAWLTPVEPKSKKFRCAQMWFGVERGMDTLRIKRSDSDDQTVRRGTVQHEVFEGSDVVAFLDSAKLLVRVNCKADAKLSKKVAVKYALAITVESADRQVTTIYNEIRQKLASRVRVAT